MSDTTASSTFCAAAAVQLLLMQIAEEADIAILRWDDETLAEFAARLEDELAQKIIDCRDFIDEIRALDLDQVNESTEGA